jgi:hypothetical protein
MLTIKVDPDVLRDESGIIREAGGKVLELGEAVRAAGLRAPSYEGRFGPRVAGITGDISAALPQTSGHLAEHGEVLRRKGDDFDRIDRIDRQSIGQWGRLTDDLTVGLDSKTLLSIVKLDSILAAAGSVLRLGNLLSDGDKPWWEELWDAVTDFIPLSRDDEYPAACPAGVHRFPLYPGTCAITKRGLAARCFIEWLASGMPSPEPDFLPASGSGQPSLELEEPVAPPHTGLLYPDPDSPVPLAEQFSWFRQNQPAYTEPNGPYPLPGSIQEWLAKLAGYDVPLRKDITASEAAILNELWPRQLLQGDQILDEAADMELKNYGTVWNDDGVPDAFRHAYWAARRTQAFGADWAKRFTDAHEGKIDNPDDRDFMDRWNNNLGIQIALEHPDASPEELANLIARSVNDGKGVYIPGGDVENGPLAYTNQGSNAPVAPILPVDNTGSGIQ